MSKEIQSLISHYKNLLQDDYFVPKMNSLLDERKRIDERIANLQNDRAKAKTEIERLEKVLPYYDQIQTLKRMQRKMVDLENEADKLKQRGK